MIILFTSDLHGKIQRYNELFRQVENIRPDVVLLGGDLLPHVRKIDFHEFVEDFLIINFDSLRSGMKEEYPFVGLILGNDDPGIAESIFIDAQKSGIWTYLHMNMVHFKGIDFYGYSFVPPTPFLLKDWEKYDVSRYVDPGCVPPDEGFRTKEPDYDTEFATIADDLERLSGHADVSQAVFLFHSPPYQTKLDRAALDGKMIDHIPLDVHVGSIAIRRFIESRQPFLTLHGHIHESTFLTGHFSDKLGKTWMFNGANHTHELPLIVIDTDSPENTKRLLYP